MLLAGSINAFIPAAPAAQPTCVILPHPFAMLRKPISLCTVSNYVLRPSKSGYSRSSQIKMMIDPYLLAYQAHYTNVLASLDMTSDQLVTEQQVWQQGVLTSIFAAIALCGVAAEKDMLSRKERHRLAYTSLYSEPSEDEFDPSAPVPDSCFMIPTPATVMMKDGVREAHACITREAHVLHAVFVNSPSPPSCPTPTRAGHTRAGHTRA